MSITTIELNSRVAELRSLKALKEETELAIKALEMDIITFLTGNDLAEYIGTDYKATYKTQSRTALDKDKLVNDFGNLKDYEKVTTFNVLRIS